MVGGGMAHLAAESRLLHISTPWVSGNRSTQAHKSKSQNQFPRHCLGNSGCFDYGPNASGSKPDGHDLVRGPGPKPANPTTARSDSMILLTMHLQ